MTASNDAAQFLGNLAGNSITIGKDYSTAMDAAKVGNTAFNQGAQQAIIEGVALACKAQIQDASQIFTTELAAGSHSLQQAFLDLVVGLGVSFYFAEKAEDYCTLAGKSYVQSLQAQIGDYQTLLNTDFSAFLTTVPQASDLAAYNAALSAGNFAGMVAATNSLAAATNFVGTTNSDGSAAYQQAGFSMTVSSNWQPVSFVTEITDDTSQVTTYNSSGYVSNNYSGPNGTGSITSSQVSIDNSDGSTTTTSYAGANGTGSITSVDRENVDGSSQITTYNPVFNPGSSTATTYSGPNGTGSITKIDQENANGTSSITTYGPGGPTTINYSGPNGTGSITQISIKSATANIVSTATPGVFEYTYTGPEFSTFQNPSGFTGTSPLQGQKITASIILDLNGIPLVNGYYSVAAKTFSISDGVTSYSGPPLSGNLAAFANLVLNSDYQVVGWAVEEESRGPSDPGISGEETSSYNGSTTDEATVTNSTGMGFQAQVYTTTAAWSQPENVVSVAVSPLAGQIQQLSSVLTNPSLTAQGALQNLTISGPGTVAVTGSYSLPNIVNNGSIAISSGVSLQVTSRLVEGAGSAVTGVVAGVGAGTTIELASGKSGSISSGLSNIGTIAVDPGASWTVTGSYSLPNIVDNGAIVLASGASLQVTSRLVEGAGSAVTGVVAGAGASTTIELVSGKSGSISSGLSNIGTIAVDAGASWMVTGSYSLPNIVDNGAIVVGTSSSLDIFTALDPASTGIFQLQNSSTLEVAAALGHGTQIQFLGTTNDKLVIDKASSFGTGVGTASYAGSLLDNFAAGDVIDLKGIASAGLGLNYSATSGDLQITSSAGAAMATLLFQNSSLGAGAFHAASDGAGGTLLTHS